jgi:hypothetical protein
MAAKPKQPVRKRKAIMIRPAPDLLELMQKTAEKEGLSLNKLALDIIETSGRLGTQDAVGERADITYALVEVEIAVRRLRAAIQ